MIKEVKYQTPTHFAEKWGVTRAKISQWFLDGRLKGAIKPFRDVLIPINTERPTPQKAGRKAIK